MEQSAKIFLSKDIEVLVKTLQKNIFDMVDDLKASDLDSYQHLKEILKDEDLAKRFMLFHENRTKIIRKKILDSTGDLNRAIYSLLEDYNVDFNQGTEFDVKFK
jgi:hypothetical protein